MCFAPKAPQIQAPPPPVAPPPISQAPLAPESPTQTSNNVRTAATARKKLRIDLATPNMGAGLKIPM